MSYTSTISGLSRSTFPGAYIMTGYTSGSNGSIAVPIHTSMSFATSVDNEFLTDKDYGIYVLPGYKIHVFSDIFAGIYYTIDNTFGTEILYRVSGKQNVSSCMLLFNNSEI